MKKHNINITNATTIEAHGNHTNGNCKKVYIVEKDMVCTSMTDAAEVIGCSLDAVSNVIRGKQRTCRDYHIIDLSKMGEAFPQLMEYSSHIPTTRAKANGMSRKELAELRAKAKAYDKLMAEKEAERKAEEKARQRKEKYEAKKVKLMADIERHKSIAEKHYAKGEEATRKQMKAEQKLEALLDKEVK